MKDILQRIAGLRRHWILLAGLACVFVAGVGSGVVLLESGLAGKVKARLVAPPAPVEPALGWVSQETSLQTIETLEIPLGNVDGVVDGGGLDAVGETVLFVTGLGRIGYLDLASGAIGYLESGVPMNFDALREHRAWDEIEFNRKVFRAHDILLQHRGGDLHDLYVTHHHFQDSGQICTRLSRADVTITNGIPVAVSDFDTVYEIDPCIDLADVDYGFDGHMSGGRLHESDDGRLYLTVGDFGFGGKKNRNERVEAGAPGDLASLLLVDPDTGMVEVIAEGLRNAQGLEVDDQGRIWTTEHGPQGGDEVNLIRKGGNYGWPYVSLGFSYGEAGYPRIPLRWSVAQGRHDGYEKPVYAFVPSVATSQILAMPQASEAFGIWRGDLLVSSLMRQSLFRIRLDGDTAIYAEPIPMGGRIRDMIFLDDGRLALMRDDKTLVIVRDPETHEDDAADAVPFELSGFDEVEALEATLGSMVSENWGQDLFRWKCASCHALNGEAAVGPPLAGIVGSRIGATEGYPYSPALSQADGRWKLSRLRTYVIDPAGAGLGGSSMPPVSQLNRNQLNAIFRFLEEDAPQRTIDD